MRIPLLALTLAAGLAACELTPRPTLDPGFGASVRHNMAAQVVTPQPPAAAAADQDGRRAAAAWQRYRDGKVIPPGHIDTSRVSRQGEKQ